MIENFFVKYFSFAILTDLQFHLTGDGIDREKLVRGEDIEFGIELDEQEAIEEEVQNYFDAETVFKTLSFDCCREEEDDSDKVSCYFVKKIIFSGQNYCLIAVVILLLLWSIVKQFCVAL